MQKEAQKQIRIDLDQFKLQVTHLHLAATYSILGNPKKARDHIKALSSINPEFFLKLWENYMSADWRNKSDVDRWVGALNRAGLQ